MKMNKRSCFGWFELVAGILLIALGIFTFIRPGSVLTWIILIYGFTALVMGVEDIVVYVKSARFTGFGPMLSLISGIMSVMCGIMILAYPEAGKWALTLLFPIWFIAHCISRLAHIGIIRMFECSFYYYFTVAVNIVGILLGFFMVFSPVLTFVTMRTVAYIAAVYLILFGIESIVAAFGRRHSGW